MTTPQAINEFVNSLPHNVERLRSAEKRSELMRLLAGLKDLDAMLKFINDNECEVVISKMEAAAERFCLPENLRIEKPTSFARWMTVALTGRWQYPNAYRFVREAIEHVVDQEVE